MRIGFLFAFVWVNPRVAAAAPVGVLVDPVQSGDAHLAHRARSHFGILTVPAVRKEPADSRESRRPGEHPAFGLQPGPRPLVPSGGLLLADPRRPFPAGWRARASSSPVRESPERAMGSPYAPVAAELRARLLAA